MSVESPSQPVPVQGHRGLHPMWIGAIALFMLTMSLVILVGHTLFDFAWQRQFGIWNIWVGSALAVGIVIPLRIWTTSADKA